MAHKVFIDTQYTSLERPKLISFGACSEHGRMFYAELEGDWTQEDCSELVRERAIPALSLSQRLDGRAAAQHFVAWLQSTGASDIELVSMHTLDRDLVCGVDGFVAEANRRGVNVSHRPLARVEQVDAGDVLSGVERFFSGLGPAIPNKAERHHALNGAIALRYGYNLAVGTAARQSTQT